MKTISKDTVLVVIPYYAPGAQGRELELAVAGWRKHFKEDFLIVLVGEDIERGTRQIQGEDILKIESRRVSQREGNYRQHLDYVSCFRKVRMIFRDSKGFVFTADDGYAVNDFDLTDVKVLKMHSPDFAGDPNSMNGWRRDMAKTRDLLDSEGLPHRNFCTHIPQWYEWDKLEAMWAEYDMDNNSYLFEEIYFNKYYRDRLPVQLNLQWDNYRCGIWRNNPDMNIVRLAFKNKIWITNSVEGWLPEVEQMLAEHYGL